MKRSLFLVATVVALFAVFAITPSFAQYSSSQQTTPDQSQTSQPSQSQPSTGSMSQSSSGSSDVQSSIQKALQQDPSLASSSVSANVTDNKIELTGSVSSAADKDKAEQIAQQNAGSRKVENKIQVSGSTSSQPPSSTQPPQ